MENLKKLNFLFDHNLEGRGENITELRNEYHQKVIDTTTNIQKLWEEDKFFIESKLIQDFNSIQDYEKYLLEKGIIAVTIDNHVIMYDEKYLKYLLKPKNLIEIENTNYLKNENVIVKFIEMLKQLDFKTINIDSSLMLSQIEQMDLKAKSLNNFIVDLNEFCLAKLEYSLDIIIEIESELEKKEELEKED